MSTIRAVSGDDAASSSAADIERARSKYQAKSMMERIPWRSAGTSIIGLGTPAGISVVNPLFGELIFSIELIVILTLIATALFASPELSERSFRLLRWFGNRPEPPAPGEPPASQQLDLYVPGDTPAPGRPSRDR